ncbi:hypothetical protein GUITHDRAFT_144334 [Guillardia theta CCMP2712]|uniref:Uncharacterized protein n=1 Tax=Guillardia theta (strain CCMP2712) TaxID=905079 RepID=L1IQQ6_GUITC|nr:hypothetical protein GUITHDRAFT_144334 [Guillardia theta CCMP2712]EKX38214.1 hypothetical protein GUITHDRAFT_144334 [Guillardia theta CCMP2712]|eukprot:XP_005825194.1 hypothetical protein GUITHDRAFT_144334 [Guillardia theta CCMP2712]
MTPAQRLTHAFLVIELCAIPFSLASGSSRVPETNLRLRGGSGTMQYTSTQPKQTQVDSLLEGERKPDLKKTSSRLILEEMQVTEEEYMARVSSVANRVIDPWISQSDRGGFKEGDVLVPDHCSSIPEAVARVRHDGTVYIRKGLAKSLPGMQLLANLSEGTYKWDGVLVVQKHMHLRGEPNPDEGDGQGRPTLEGIARFDQNKKGPVEG